MEPKWLSKPPPNDTRLDAMPQQDASVMDVDLSYADVILGSDVIFTNASRHDLINNELVQATFCLLYLVIFVLGIFCLLQ